MALQFCIYCGGIGGDKLFSKEHIIPQSIGGTLFLEDVVCSGCNSWLGANVDAEILKVPSVMDAFEALHIPYDKAGMLKNYFTVVGSVNGLELRGGRLGSRGIEFPPQVMADGSFVAPVAEFIDPLRKRILRDPRLSATGLSRQVIEDRCEKFLDSCSRSKPGDEVRAPELGRRLVNRSGKLEIKVVPREEARPEPLIAKIAYELLHLAGGRKLFQDSNDGTWESLRDCIEGRDTTRRLTVLRLKPDEEGYRPFHAVDLSNEEEFLSARILFFGFIYYRLLCPPLARDFFSGIEGLARGKVKGFGFQQSLDEDAQSFFAIMHDGSARRLDPASPQNDGPVENA